MNDEVAISERPESDTTVLLSETLLHIRRQNEHQQNQLIKSDEVIRLISASNLRANLLLFVGVLLLVLGGVEQFQIFQFQDQQRQSRDRLTLLEKEVDQTIGSTANLLSQKVDQLTKASPRVVTDAKGDLSLSVPITPASPKSTTVTTIPLVRSHRTTKAAPASSASDFALVPLQQSDP